MADADAISKAVTRKTVRFVPIKRAQQQAAAIVLKTRALLVRQRTQAVNALRAHLTELGIIATAGLAKVEALVAIIRDETDARLPAAARFALIAIADEIEVSADQVERLERAIVVKAKRDDDTSFDHNPWRRHHYGGDHQGAGSLRVQVGSPLCRLAGTDAAVSFKRRQRAAGTNIEHEIRNSALCSLSGQRPSCGFSATTLGRGRG